MNSFLQKVLYKTMYIKIDESKLDIRYIKLNKREISYFSLSSNTIISFRYEGNYYYFRECPILLGKDDYFRKSIDVFFETVFQTHINKEHFMQEIPIKVNFSLKEVSDFRNYVYSMLLDKMYLKKISSAYKISLKNNFNIWEKQIYTQDFFNEYGLKNLPPNCQDIAIYFLWYMKNVSFNYRTLYIAYGKKYSYFSSVKSVATKIVAETLGLEHMITSAEYCLLKFDDGETMFGVLSLAAEGVRMLDSKVKITGCLQKELMNMNILDLICFQTDHGVNNYNVEVHDGKCRVCAFDNDNPNTFFPFPMIKYNFLGCSSIINADGLLNRPYIDYNLVANLLNMDLHRLKTRLKSYLNCVQIFALILRIKRLQKLLEKTIAINPSCVISNDEWNDVTVTEELSGKYGKTYLTIVAEQQDINENIGKKRTDLI